MKCNCRYNTKPNIKRTMRLFASASVNLAASLSSELPPLPPGEEIYGLRPPVKIPFDWTAFLLKAVLLLLLAWAAYVWWKRKKAVESEVLANIDKTIDYEKEALEALERLRSSAIWRDGRIKDICEHLARIFKDFLHDKYKIGQGASATTSEMESALKRLSGAEIVCSEALKLLEICDAIKFARGNLGSITCDELFDRFKALIVSKDWER